MKIKTIIVLCCCMFFGLGVVVGYLKGRKDSLLSNFKTYHANLVILQSSLPPKPGALAEFLKARYYYFGNRIPADYLPLVSFDYGSVDTNLLNDLNIVKGPTTAALEYGAFQETLRHLRQSGLRK